MGSAQHGGMAFTGRTSKTNIEHRQGAPIFFSFSQSFLFYQADVPHTKVFLSNM